MASLNGTSGDDTLVGGSDSDTLGGLDGNDSLFGGDGADSLAGHSGNDTLDGGTGADTMDGRDGNDLYRVDNPFDVVIDGGGGMDTVESFVTYTLPDYVEVLKLVKAGYANGTGNSSWNTLIGNDWPNFLAGLGGLDTLIGGGGDDILDGGTGTDSMIGGTGNDRYRVDVPGDVVVEAPGEGIDTIESAVSYTLPDNVEVLLITGTTNASGTGNALANTIVGNDAYNTLSGGAGNDTLSGAGNNDYLAGGSGDDYIDGGTGNDVADFSGVRAGYRIAVAADGTVTVTDIDPTNGNDGVDTLISVETLRFTDTSQTSANYAPDAQADKTISLLEDAAAVSLGITAPTDQDGDQLTIVVTAVPTGAIGSIHLAASDGGGLVSVGTTLTSAQLTGLVFQPGPNGSGNAAFTYVVSDPSQAWDTQTVTLAVAPVADTPSLVVPDVQGAVNQPIALSITAALTDTDGSETLSLSVGGLPVGARLSDGVHQFIAGVGNVNVDISGWTLSSLTITPPPNSEADFDFNVTAIATDGSSQAYASDSVHVVVTSSAPSSLDLGLLDGTSGFRIDGGWGEEAGLAVTSAGDVNGDGFDDILIGAPFVYSGSSLTGGAYLVFGGSGGWSPVVSLTTGSAVEIGGVAAYDTAGWSVASAGDVNGDGLDDVVIGAPGVDALGDTAGAAYVVFGRAGGWGSSLSLATLNGGDGFRVVGPTTGSELGYSVSSAGDVNGDGFDDLLVGAPVTNGRGAAWVVFGQGSGWTGTFNLAAINGTNGFRMSGASVDTYAGCSVASAGDINGDGYDDVIVGSEVTTINGIVTGAAYVVFGHATGWTANIDFSVLNGSNGFRISGGTSGDQMGHSVASAGDINGDGFDDLIIGAPYADVNGNSSGSVYVVFGHAGTWSATLPVGSLDGSNGFRIIGRTVGDWAGHSVASAGDVNGDGYDDLIIGASRNDAGGVNAGTTYIAFGHAGGWGTNLDVATLTGSAGFRLVGDDPGDSSGFSVSSAGDVNGDGFDDLLVGSPYAGENGDVAGSTYVVFGRDFVGGVTYLGTASADTMTGTAAAERFVGGLGGDSIIGGGGADVLEGGMGDDTFVIGPGLPMEVDGGGGYDTVRLGAAQATLDFRTIDNNRFADIEKLDFTGDLANTVTLTTLDILDMVGSGKELTIDGDAADRLTVVGNWLFVGQVAGHLEYVLDQVHPSATARPTLLIDTDLSLTLLA